MFTVEKRVDEETSLVYGQEGKRRAITIRDGDTVTFSRGFDVDIVSLLMAAIFGNELEISSLSKEGEEPKERIVCAAIKEWESGRVHMGESHGAIISAELARTGRRVGARDTYGFITDRGRFVGREEAAGVAFASGQISRIKERLTSDDYKHELGI
jgi:hypothetical protein